MTDSTPTRTPSGPETRLYADASGMNNKFAWAFVLKTPDLTIEGSGRGGKDVNDAELLAVMEGLRRVSGPVVVYTDSLHVIRELRRMGMNYVKVGKGKGHFPDHRKAHHLAREATN